MRAILFLSPAYLLPLLGACTSAPSAQDSEPVTERPAQTDPETDPEEGLRDPACGGQQSLQAELGGLSPELQVQACAGCDGEGYVSELQEGAWVELELSVDQMGQVPVQFALLTPGGTLRIERVEELGSTVLGYVEVPDTEGEMRCSPIADLVLPGGPSTLRVVPESGVFGVDYLAVSETSVAEVSAASPEKNRGPEINPMKGWNSGWWVDSDYSSVGFQYIEWSVLEPEDDQFDWEAVEEILNRPGSQGRHLILQFVVDWDYSAKVEDNYKGPDWLLERVSEFHGTDPWNPDREMRATDYNDPVFIAEGQEAIAALYEHFADDPRAYILQVGLLGFWAEWHTFGQPDWEPSTETKEAIFGTYADLRPDHILMQARYPSEPSTGATPGLGYTNGSATLTEHGLEFNTALQAEALWENGPIGGEWPPNVADAYWSSFFDGQAGLDYIQDGHYSHLLPPAPEDLDARVPGWSDPDSRFMQAHREFGYVFHVDAVRQARAGEQLLVELDVSNSGVAAFYQDWTVELAALSDEGEVLSVVALDTDLRSWAPDAQQTLATYVQVPQSLVGQGQLALRLSQPGATEEHPEPWPLEARNAYIVLANELELVEGSWDPERNALVGGWNLLGALN